ncbi:uncharacterized protein [Montipora capricornis]|uniref:uncharacterized protein n=1 Tax=Montipora capricornis TaxID=246305 RepID=UPI0035F2178D
MSVIVLTLSLLFLTENVKSQGCVEEALDCNKNVPTVFKVSDASCPCNDVSHSGALKFSGDELYFCSGTEWKIVQLSKETGGTYGKRTNPGASCKDILAKAPNEEKPKNGIYWIRIPSMGPTNDIPVYCDMLGGGWTMVFKAVSGTQSLFWDELNSVFTYAEFETAALDVTMDYRGTYKNRIFFHWENFNMNEVRITLYQKDEIKKEILFNAKDSNWYSWFSKDRIISSSWEDLNSGTFTIRGVCDANRYCRMFGIMTDKKGCDAIEGWLFVGGRTGFCEWEEQRHSILYCEDKKRCLFKDSDKTEYADFLTVFIK